MVYKNAFKWRTHEYPVPAQEAGEHITELENKFGEVTAEILLEDARPEGSLLHPLYCWDDTKAAEKYRLIQSGKILSELVTVHVKVVDDQEEPKPITVRAFTSVSSGNERASYRSTTFVMSQEDTRERVLANALADIRMLEKKYSDLIDFTDVVEQYLREKKETP